jgi:predicted DsbA family dithiol-disulfide isomerase
LSFVAHRVLGTVDAAIADLDIELAWHPIDLTRITGWRRGEPLDADRRVQVQSIAAGLGVPVRMPPTWLDSRPAGAVALALENAAAEATWRERIWTAAFEEGRDAGDASEIERLARDINIDVAALAPSTDALAAETRGAQERGVTAVPTLLLGDWPMPGIQDAETMLALLGRYVARRRAGPE